MNALAINGVFDRAVEQLDRERRRLLSHGAASTAPGQPKFDYDGFHAISRAVSYVIMGGVLEELMRLLPSALASDLVALGIERRQLPVSLIAATDAASFRK